MTNATINGKRQLMSIYEKAKLLNVSRIPGEAGYVVSSGSDPRKSYRVSEDCQHCNCDAYGRCSHLIAAGLFRSEEYHVSTEPIYGTCGHLARRADRSCGCC